MMLGNNVKTIFVTLLLVALVVASYFVSNIDGVDPRKDSLRNQIVKSYSIGGSESSGSHREELTQILSRLVRTINTGSAGNAFEKCEEELLVIYENDQSEFFTFYTRRGLVGCALVKSSESFVHYDSRELLVFLRQGERVRNK